MRVEFFPAAEQELLDAASEYEGHLSGLGRGFILEIERLSSVLIELPSLGEKLDPIHRRIPLRRFPYAHIAAVGHVIGRHAYKTANKRVQPTCENARG